MLATFGFEAIGVWVRILSRNGFTKLLRIRKNQNQNFKHENFDH